MEENVAKIDYKITQLDSEIAKKKIVQEYLYKKKELAMQLREVAKTVPDPELKSQMLFEAGACARACVRVCARAKIVTVAWADLMESANDKNMPFREKVDSALYQMQVCSRLEYVRAHGRVGGSS